MTERRTFTDWVLNRPAKVEQREALPGVIPPSWESLTGSVSSDAALSIPTVFRCVNIITTSISQLTFSATNMNGENINPLVIRQPDSERSLSNFLKRTAHDLAVDGNAFWKITLNSSGQLMNLQVLNPAAVFIDRHPTTGKKRYRVGEKTYNDSQIKHLRFVEHYGHERGLSPIGAYREGLAADIALRKYAGDVFNNGVPPIYLSTDQEIDPETATQMEARWAEKTKDGNIPVLGRGLNVNNIGLSLEDLKYIESQNLSDLHIAQIYGIDGAFLGLTTGGSSLTYTNRQDLDIQLIRYTLMGYLKEIESAFSELMPRGTEVRFNVEDWLRAYEAITPKEGVTTPQA